MKKKKNETSQERNLRYANEGLEKFIKELTKNGFTKGIRKLLNLEWQENDTVFNRAVEGLKGVTFDVKNVKFVELHMPEKIFRFLTKVNGLDTHLFVRPMKIVNDNKVVGFDGNYGVIPVKLMKFIIKNKEEKDKGVEKLKKEIRELNKLKKSENESDKI